MINGMYAKTLVLFECKVPCLLNSGTFLCMSVHDDQGHDEEANIQQDDHQHWCNECPHKVTVWI